MRSNKKQFLIDMIGITAGSAITALALAAFLIPNKIAAGGVSGLATVIYYIFGFPVGITMLVLNVPIFIAGVKFIGFSFGARTIYGMIILSLFVDIFQQFVPALTQDILLATIYGGIVGGLGLGLVFNSKGTTGGTDMIARLINHFTGYSVGQSLLIADGFVVTMAGIFFNLEVALYAALTIFISSKTIDVLQEGIGFSKAAFIISKNPDRIRQGIIDGLDRGVTVLKGYGGYTGDEKDVLLCIISRSELVKLKRLVHQIDSKAFVIITTVHEVLGEGFKETVE